MSEALALFDFASGSASSIITEQQSTLPGFVDEFQAFDRASAELSRLLRANIRITEKLLAEALGNAYGSDETTGAWSIQTAYNALETALVKRLLELRTTDLETAEELIALLPTQRRRTEEKERLQQFSTPPTICALAALAARITGFDRVLEPSAGNGLLAAYGRLYGASVSVNELDPERAHGAAMALRTTCTSLDAGTLSVRYNGERPTVVLMNPPFSADGFASGSDVGFTHITEALRVLQDGGRLVTILADFQHPSIKPAAWDAIVKLGASIRYAHVIEGKAYKVMGTEFPTCIVVLDKTPNLSPVSRGNEPKSVADLYNALPELPRARIDGISYAASSTVDEIATKKRNIPSWLPTFNEEISPLRYQRNTDRKIETVGANANYVPSLLIEGAKPHPTPLIESSTLAHIDGPMPSVNVLLPTRVVKDGILSDAQLETVIYAAQAHDATFSLTESYLNDEQGITQEFIEGVRRGFMVGHGTGFGKGRCIAGIILSNVLAGRTKAIWVSESQALFEDAQRDWSDVAGAEHAHALINLSAFSPNDVIGRAHGIVFMTYATMRSPAKQRSRSRLEQILEWVGNDDVVFIVDESHNLANAVASKGTQGSSAASQQGLVALEIQRKCPTARVVYTSATSASKVDAFAYAPRLGLWSSTSSFPSRSQFLADMEKGGLGAMEMIARDLKALGLYVSSSLSLEGVSYERLEHALTDEQLAQYNTIAGAWRVIYENVDAAIEFTNSGSQNTRAVRAALEMSRIRSLQAVLTTQKLPTVLDHMQRALDNGKSVVIQLTNTYEAQQERALEGLNDATDLELLDLSPREMIVGFLERSFPVGMYREIEDEDGVKSVPVLDENGKQLTNPDAVSLREDLVALVRSMVCPDGPLEIILDTFGVENVAEVTGRSRRVVRTIVDGKLTRIIETRPSNAALAETADFMAGKKRILLFSEAAGGTGRSYHAALACENQQQRYHYLLQTGWRSDRALQGLGRSHRTHQAQPPYWILCTSNVPGERRFLSTIARRLEQLGACTKGQRDAVGTGLFSSDDNLETPFGSSAVKALLRDVAGNRVADFDYERWVEQTNMSLYDSEGKERIDEIPVHRFLNKLLACDVDVQGILLDRLVVLLDEIVEIAKARGEYDFGIQPLPGLSFELTESKALYNDADSGATALLLTLRVERKVEPKYFGNTLANIRQARQHYGSREAGFRTSEEGIFGFYRLASTSSKDTPYKIVRPSGSRLVEYYPYGTEITDDAARDLWEAEMQAVTDVYFTTEYFVSGTMLPIYGRLPDANPRIYRFATADDKRFIGRHIRTEHLKGLLEKFGLSHSFSIDDMLSSLKNGATIRFNRNFTLKRSRLNGKLRYELVVPPALIFTHAKTFTNLGAIRETISYSDRLFIPETHLPTIAEHLERTFGLQLIEAAAA